MENGRKGVAMTENETIKKLSYDDTAYGGACTEEVRKTAIKALEEVAAVPGDRHTGRMLAK